DLCESLISLSRKRGLLTRILLDYNLSPKKLHCGTQTDDESLVPLGQIDEDFEYVPITLLGRITSADFLSAHQRPDARDAAGKPLLGESVNQDRNRLTHIDAADVTFVHFRADSQSRGIRQAYDGLRKDCADSLARVEMSL